MYAPNISRMIMLNRQEEREELNDILGDISPYWNMEELIDDDDEYDSYDGEYSEEEEEYFEEY